MPRRRVQHKAPLPSSIDKAARLMIASGEAPEHVARQLSIDPVLARRLASEVTAIDGAAVNTVRKGLPALMTLAAAKHVTESIRAEDSVDTLKYALAARAMADGLARLGQSSEAPGILMLTFVQRLDRAPVSQAIDVTPQASLERLAPEPVVVPEDQLQGDDTALQLALFPTEGLAGPLSVTEAVH